MPLNRILPQRSLLFVLFFILLIAFASAFNYLRSTEGMLNPAVILQLYLLSNGFVPYSNIEDPRAPLLPLLLSSLMLLFDGNVLRTARLSHSLVVFVLALLILWWLYKAKGRWALLAGGLFFWGWSLDFGYWAIACYEVILAPLFYFRQMRAMRTCTCSSSVLTSFHGKMALSRY